MQNLTLHFNSLPELSAFLKQLYGGYLLNTMNLTITACFSEHYLNVAINQYNAMIVDTGLNANSYNNRILSVA